MPIAFEFTSLDNLAIDVSIVTLFLLVQDKQIKSNDKEKRNEIQRI